MKRTSYTFPFGQRVRPVAQEDRSPKKVFILGVYASAVHARWVGPDDKTKIMALAVASEPYIFWRGDGAQGIIDKIDIPEKAGKLVAAASNLNGPSGNTLDHAFIEPLGLTRDDCWLCDIYPHACMNPKQRAAVEREYVPIAGAMGLPVPNMPPEPKSAPGQNRRAEILAELEESKAETVVLLGDFPPTTARTGRTPEGTPDMGRWRKRAHVNQHCDRLTASAFAYRGWLWSCFRAVRRVMHLPIVLSVQFPLTTHSPAYIMQSL